VASEYADEIAARFPKVFRRNGGYALDRVRTIDGRTNVEQVIVGSEGTLCVTVAATLKLLPLPVCKGLAVIHYDDLVAALRSVPAILAHQPAAIELLDKLILDGTKDNPVMRPRRWFLEGDPAAILIVELYDDNSAALQRRLEDLAADMRARRIGYACRVITEPPRQADVWDVRKAATGLLLSRPGDVQPHDFIDDCAVEPARLADYIARLNEIMAEEGVEQAGYYAHASVGLLHVRPALNLKTHEGVQKLRRIADRVSLLVREFGGALTGEHGEGIVRSEWIERMFGPALVEAFRRVKTAFDPLGILNPGKIVDPLPMTPIYGTGVISNPTSRRPFWTSPSTAAWPGRLRCAAVSGIAANVWSERSARRTWQPAMRRTPHGPGPTRCVWPCPTVTCSTACPIRRWMKFLICA
jgi:FAD/FMN-containing dehydrogenase